MAESNLRDAVDRWLRTQEGVWWFKVFGSGFQRGGLPDVVMCVYGVFVGIELKQPGEKAKLRQNHELRKIREAGGVGVSCRTLIAVKQIVEHTIKVAKNLHLSDSLFLQVHGRRLA